MEKKKLKFEEKRGVLRGWDEDGNVILKRCSVCRILKFLDEFRKSDNKIDFKKSYCKVCEYEYLKEYRENGGYEEYFEKNKERFKKYRDEYNEKNREYFKKWYWDNRDELLIKSKEWYKNWKERKKGES